MTRDDLLTYDGTTQSISEWSLDYGIPPALIVQRLNRGLSAEQAITRPMRTKAGERLPIAMLTHERSPKRNPRKGPQGNKAKLHEHDGESLTVHQWAERTGLSPLLLYKRLRAGMTMTQAIERGVKSIGKPTRMITHNGVTMSIGEWAAKLGVTKNAINIRFKLGWPPNRIFSDINQAGNFKRLNATRYEHGGEHLTLAEWSERVGIKPETLWRRIRKGWPIEAALNTPLSPRSRRHRGGRSKAGKIDSRPQPSATRAEGNKSFSVREVSPC